MIRQLNDVLLPIIDAIPNVDVYAPGTVPDLPPRSYVVMYLSRRGVGANADRNRLSDSLTGVGWRVDCLFVGKSVKEVYWLEDAIAAELESQRLTIDGYPTTKLHHETSRPVGEDPGVKGLFTSASLWTCVSTALQPA